MVFRKATKYLTSAAVLSLIFVVGTKQEAINSQVSREKRLKGCVRCPGQVISPSSLYHSVGARSVLECASLCLPDCRCLSIVFDGDNKQCYLGDDISRSDCSNMEPSQQIGGFYEKEFNCTNQNEEPGPKGKCVCAKGFRGSPCEPYIGDCTEGYLKGNITKNGILMIHPLQAPDPFPVYCNVKTNNIRTYIMDRRAKLPDFNRTFAEYENGFGDLQGTHWLGLRQVHYLSTSKQYELRVSGRLSNGSSMFMQYQIFRVSDATTGYQLFANQTANETYWLADCFAPLYATRFSAFDNDNDGNDEVNCAALRGGGFWYKGGGCGPCNPTGPLLGPWEDNERSGPEAELFWPDVYGSDVAHDRMNMYLVVLGVNHTDQSNQ